MAAYKMSKKGERSHRVRKRKEREEAKALDRMGQAKERGIENPPDLPALTGLEKGTRDYTRKKMKSETELADRYEREGVISKEVADRARTQNKGVLAASEKKYKERSDKRKKESAARYRKGVKAY